jgi:hypothetical protein
VAEFVEVFGGAGGDYFDIAVFSVADPAVELEFAGFTVNEPAEAYALYAALNEEMKDHIDQSQSFKEWRCGATRHAVKLNPRSQTRDLAPRRASFSYPTHSATAAEWMGHPLFLQSKVL